LESTSLNARYSCHRENSGAAPREWARFNHRLAEPCSTPPDLRFHGQSRKVSDNYYANVADIERQVFMVDLDRQQAIFGAAGLGTIPSESLRQVEAMTQ
jgi:hypothetical protein